MKWPYAVAIFLAGFFTLLVFLGSGHFAVLFPHGTIAWSERTLMFHATLLMLIVIVPTLLLAFFFAWHYRAGNTKAIYQPEWEHSRMDELVWWAIPLEIILVLGALTWTSTHELDPHRALASSEAPLTIEVVALDWKWLFIYPEQHIASINFVEIPTNRPIRFEITADAPMNSFWIPELGGQTYAMQGMVNPLSLEADRPGDYNGSSANYSGDGFAKMKFITQAVSPNDFDAWVANIKQSPQELTSQTYTTLAAPGESKETDYGSVDDTLYNSIVMKYMSPTEADHSH